jgi:hypothetical protein
MSDAAMAAAVKSRDAALVVKPDMVVRPAPSVAPSSEELGKRVLLGGRRCGRVTAGREEKRSL